jgi:hypothetical protein
MGAQTKHPETKRPETKRPWTKRPWGQNVRGDKTSVGTKRPSDKTSVRTKRPSDKTSGGRNVREDKTSVGTKRPSGSYLPGPCEAIFFTDKNLLSVKEKSANTYTLCGRCGGSKHVQYLTERLFIFIKQFTSNSHVFRCTIYENK